MDNITYNDKRNLMNKFKKDAIVKHSKVDGERFVIECFDYKSLLVGLRKIYADGSRSPRILWTDPEYIIPATLDEAYNYCVHDIEMTKTIYNTVSSSRMNIKNAIFNDPATIVFWSDGSKTVVKSHLDDYDPEKGLAMAIAKKALGNEGNYYNVFKKWLPKDDETIETSQTSIGELFYDKKVNDILNKALDDIKKKHKK